MQVLTECIHKFITTDTEDVCVQCGYVKPELQEIPQAYYTAYVFDGLPTPIAGRYHRMQRYAEQKYLKDMSKIRVLVSLFCKELGVHHTHLESGTISLYKHSRSRGLNRPLTVSACFYVTARRMHIPITLTRLADVIIKHGLVPGQARNHRGLRRHIQRLIYNLASKCMRLNEVEQRPTDIHPIVIMLSQTGARCGHDPVLTRQCITAVNTILAADPNAFAGRKPAGEAALLLHVIGGMAKRCLARDFGISAQHIRGNLIRVRALLDKYGIEHPAIS